MPDHARFPPAIVAGEARTRLENLVRAIGFPLPVLAAMLTLVSAAHAGQPLETESTRLLRAREFEIEAGFEHQRASTGTESAAPFALGYGLTDRLELLIEPVFLDRVHDKGLGAVQGIGDLELTLTSDLFRSADRRSGFALAGEAKLPTARNRRIGSGQADFTLWSIASRQSGSWDTHANLGYTIIGKPAGVSVTNVVNYGLAEEYRVSSKWEIVAEVFGNTAALAEGADTPSATGESVLTPEIGGAETVGALGVRWHAATALTWSLGISYDSKQALLVHPGLSIKF